MANYQVVWKGPVKIASGLGIASRAYALALKRQGVDIRIGETKNDSFLYKKTRKHKVLVYHHAPNNIDFNVERKYFDTIILNTVWETTRIPERWLPNINKFDAVCVPSIHNKRAMRRSGVKVPIFIVPHGVDTRMFNPYNKKLPLRNSKGRFVFVSVFGFQHRKNPEALLRAYWEEFTPADNVLLVIKTNGYESYENKKWIMGRIRALKERLGIRKKAATGRLITRPLNIKQLKGVYTLGNAFVLPTRGEGVGLPFLESLASGVPVITTGWGGHMDFLTPKNSFFVKYKLQNPADSMNTKYAISRSFHDLFAEKGQRWAEADIKSLRRQMRLAYENPLLCKQKGRQGRRDMLAYSWDRAGRSLKQAIEEVIRLKKR